MSLSPRKYHTISLLSLKHKYSFLPVHSPRTFTDAQKGTDVTLPTGHLYELWPSDSLQERIRSLVFVVQMSCGPWPQRYDKSWQPAQDRHTTLTEPDKNVRWLKSFPQRAAQEDFSLLCHLPQKLDLMDCVKLDTFHNFIRHPLQWIRKVSHASVSSPLYQHCSSNRILIKGKFAKLLWCRRTSDLRDNEGTLAWQNQRHKILTRSHIQGTNNRNKSWIVGEGGWTLK